MPWDAVGVRAVKLAAITCGGMLLATGCETSAVLELDPRLQASRCVDGQAFVGGDAEQDSSGRVGALSVTTNRDSACDGELPIAGSGWTYLYARTKLWYFDGGYVLCGQAQNVLGAAASESQVGAVHYEWCGSGPYRTEGYHEVARSSTGATASANTYTPLEPNS